MAKRGRFKRVAATPKEEQERGGPKDENPGVKNENQGIKDEDEDEDDHDDNDDCFFESLDRVPSSVKFCLELPTSSSSDDDDGEDDPRLSFASAVGLSFRLESLRLPPFEDEATSGCGKDQLGNSYDYNIWMAEPISIEERRRRLRLGMGLASSRELAGAFRTVSTRKGIIVETSAANARDHAPAPAPQAAQVPAAPPTPSPQLQPVLQRCRSDNQIDARCGSLSHGRVIRRSNSSPASFGDSRVQLRIRAIDCPGEGEEDKAAQVLAETETCLIKNPNTGKELAVSDSAKDGTGELKDPQTGLKSRTDELDQVVGHSPIAKEVMRRVSMGVNHESPAEDEKTRPKSGAKPGNKKKGGWLKSIKFVASPVTWLIPEKERPDAGPKGASAKSSGDGSSELMKVHQHGKSHKELTGLHMSQEINAHEGSIWTMKFSVDAQYLASGGEDHAVRVWKVQESSTPSTSLRREETHSPDENQPLSNGNAEGCADKPPLPGVPKKAKKGKNVQRSVPDYIVMPEVIFSLSERPFCSFEGHSDQVLDLSWSKSQHLLSSSVDKTVRLWDIETKACLKLFKHNDYVTCIQFNPIDDRYFISGSLDAKVRMWSIPTRQVIDWTDIHEMVTALGYTPDGQGAFIGTHKGIFRFYKISDSKLSEESQIDTKNKKKKSQPKKVTGFQFAPGDQSQVLVTSADSQVRIYEGSNLVHKYRGFRNTSSQICASCTSDGNYVVCASEDSHVFIWKRQQTRSTSNAAKSKGWTTTRSYEQFYCKDVSVAISWPSAGSNCPPMSLPPSSEKCTGSTDSQRRTEDVTHSSKSNILPPLHKKSSSSESIPPNSEEARNNLHSGPQPSTESSATVSSASQQSDTAMTAASASTGSRRWSNGSNNKANSSDTPNAWGLVFVTGSLEGKIRVYQNFGLPVRLSRQTNLF